MSSTNFNNMDYNSNGLSAAAMNSILNILNHIKSYKRSIQENY